MKAIQEGLRGRSQRLLTAAIVLALATPTAYAAATDPRHEDKKLETVEVTATPLRGTAEEISQPVELLSGEELDRARAPTLGETVSNLPGIQSSNFGAGVGRPIVRGLEGARVAVLAGGLETQDVSAVSQDHTSAVEAFLADQIEVLKGPSTLFYGSGAIGGVVNVVDGRIPERAPDTAISGRAEVRYDSVNAGNTQMVRVDAGGERFALHADAVRRNLDDYDTPDGTQANSFLETDTGALGASWLGDWGFLGFSASRYADVYGSPGEPGDPAAGEPAVFLDVDQRRVEAKAGLIAPVAWLDSVRVALARTDYEHVEFEGDEVGTRFVKDATEGRVEVAHAALGDWTGTFGLQFSDSELVAAGEEAFLPRTQSRATGVFVVERTHLGPVQLDLGARLDDVRREPESGAERSFDPLSVSVGALWHVANDWHLTLNMDHAERAPVEEELFSNGPHLASGAFEVGAPDLREEAANQIELGLRYHREGIEAKLSAYYNRFDDFIFLIDTGDVEGDLPVRQWTQDDARFRGLEAEATIRLAESDRGEWELHLLADTVRATRAGGENLPRIAPARVGGELRWARGAWRASFGAIRYAEQDDVASNETPTDGYTLVGAHAAYHFDVGDIGWEVFLDATNLTDDTARVHTSFLKDAVVLPGRGAALGIRAFF